jgi:uncharacterized membrane protein YgcG
MKRSGKVRNPSVRSGYTGFPRPHENKKGKKMRKTIIGFLAMILLMSLSGCASPQAGAQGQSEEAYLNAKPSSLPLQMKLGVGTLKLEETELAVTAQQAKDLLPLWKALRALSSDTNSTADEINALSRQIEENMTAEQLEAIKKMTWQPDELAQLIQKYGGRQAGPGAASTEMASNGRASGGGMNNAGMMPGGGSPGGGGGGMGGPPMGGGGGMMTGAGVGGMENPSASRTAVPGQAERREAAGMNLMFVEPVIRLLESKINQQ